MVSAPVRRQQASLAQARGVSQRRACALLSTARSSLRYESRMDRRDGPLLAAMRELAAHRREGQPGRRRSRFQEMWTWPGLRRKATLELNKGEARNALGRVVFFNRLGELRDRSYENQRYRASGLNLLTAAIILWNTVYLGRAVEALRAQGTSIDERLLPHVAPLGWEHINLTGDYAWEASPSDGSDPRPLRRNPLE